MGAEIILALASGVLQVVGYAIYIRGSLKDEIRPNATTWLMFAYGTALLTVLEWDKDAAWTLLVLPVTCSILSIWVAWHCYKIGTMQWPKDRTDQWSFIVDVLLTLGYVAAWLMTRSAWLAEGDRELATAWFLFLSNATTFVAFIPIMRACASDPSSEQSAPWVAWTLAYGVLAVLTVLEVGWNWLLLLYPVSNVVMHGMMVYLAREKRLQAA